MNRIKYYLGKYKIKISIIILSIIFLSLIFTRDSKNEVKASADVVIPTFEEKTVDTKENSVDKIKVDIKGEVVNPGVYEFKEGARVQDVINEAGGLTSNSNVEYINMSKRIKDEMVIIIYSNEFIEKYKSDEEKVIYIKYECDCPDRINDACITNDNILNEESNNNSESDLISINTSSIEELMRLPGIGESKAKAIIDYREKNGNFENLEDIKNVSGIGEAAYSKIKDYIKL